METDGFRRRRLLRRSIIGKLNPIESNGLLCVGGRLSAATITDDKKWPVILPGKHPVTGTIIWEVHRKEGHAGVSHMLGILRERFWIVNTKAVIKRTIRSCLTCRKLNVSLSKQQMAPLPEIRVTSHWRPFSAVGVDCFGPFFVRRGKLLETWYGCMLTCLQCRAVHLELSQSLSMDSFMLALTTFIERRGSPKIIYSDNGGSFVGADTELRKQLEQWRKDKLEGQPSVCESQRWCMGANDKVRENDSVFHNRSKIG